MKRLIWLAVAAVIVVAVVLAWPKLEEARLSRELAAIEVTQDPAERTDELKTFILDNATAPESVLGEALEMAASSAQAAGGVDAVVRLCDELITCDLPPAVHYGVVMRMDRALLQTGSLDDARRADEMARDLLVAQDAPSAAYLEVAMTHTMSPFVDARLPVELSVRGHALSDTEAERWWPYVLDRTHSSFLSWVSGTRGLDRALTVADSMLRRADNATVAGVILANIYRLAIESDEARAVGAARDLAALEDFTSTDLMNALAWDLVERKTALDVAIPLAEKALEHAASRLDSLYVLDTVGWGHHQAGDAARAVEYLERAAGLQDETPTYQDDTLRHLLAAYDLAGRTDSAIDLLATMAARSVLPDDPAIAELSRRLTQRDGSPAAMEAMVAELRYAGVEDAPPFSLRGRSGAIVSLADHRGEVLVVCFWSYG